MNMYFAVDKIAPDFVENLIEFISIAGARKDKLLIYALVDASFEYVKRRPNISAWEEQSTSLYEDTEFAGLLQASPRLIPIQGTPENMRQSLRRLVGACSGMPMLSFIGSTFSVNELKACFNPFLEIRVDDEQGFLLRFADTRILPILDSILCNEKASGWRHGIWHWWLPDRAGNLISLPNYESDQHLHGPAEKCLSVPQILFNQLIDAGESDAILDAISDQNPDLLKNKTPSALYELMERLSKPINKFEITYFSDKVMFCTTALATTEYFYTQKNFNSILRAAAWVPGKLGDAFAFIDEIIWDEVASMTNSKIT